MLLSFMTIDAASYSNAYNVMTSASVVDSLKHRWLDLTSSIADDVKNRWWQKIHDAYTEPHRHYHILAYFYVSTL